MSRNVLIYNTLPDHHHSPNFTTITPPPSPPPSPPLQTMNVAGLPCIDEMPDPHQDINTWYVDCIRLAIIISFTIKHIHQRCIFKHILSQHYEL